MHLCTVDADGTSQGAIGDYENAADAKLAAEEFARPDELRWKDPPKPWQPDALYVSQTLDDDVTENRDA